MILLINIQQFTTIIIMYDKQKSKVVICNLLKIDHSFLELNCEYDVINYNKTFFFIVIFIVVHH